MLQKNIFAILHNVPIGRIILIKWVVQFRMRICRNNTVCQQEIQLMPQRHIWNDGTYFFQSGVIPAVFADQEYIFYFFVSVLRSVFEKCLTVIIGPICFVRDQPNRLSLEAFQNTVENAGYNRLSSAFSVFLPDLAQELQLIAQSALF